MKLLKLSFSNINSLSGNFSIDFRHDAYKRCGLFLITGPTGSGKSSILDAITLALFATTARRETQASTGKEADIVLTKGQMRCFSEVLFEAKGKRYLSRWSMRLKRRSKDKGSSPAHYDEQVDLAIEENDGQFRSLTTKKREWVNAISDTLGLDYGAFMRTVLLAQGAFANFLKADNKVRSELLERITHTEIYSQIGQEISARLSKAKADLNRLDDLVSTLHVLSEEERQQKEQARSEAAQESKAKARELEVLQEALAWKKDCETKKDAVHKAQCALAAAQNLYDKLLPQKSVLQAAQKAQSVWPLWITLQESQEKLTNVTKALENAIHTRQFALASQNMVQEKARALSQAAEESSKAQTTYRETVYTPWMLHKERLDNAQANARKEDALWKKTKNALDLAQKKMSHAQEMLAKKKSAQEKISQQIAQCSLDAQLEEMLPQFHGTAAQLDLLENQCREFDGNCRSLEKDANALEEQINSTKAQEDKIHALCVTACQDFEQAKNNLTLSLNGSTWMQKIQAAQLSSAYYWAAQWAWQCHQEIESIAKAQTQTNDPSFAAFLQDCLRRQQKALETIRIAFPDLQENLSSQKVALLRKALTDWQNWSLQASQAQTAFEAARDATEKAQKKLQDIRVQRTGLENKYQFVQNNLRDSIDQRNLVQTKLQQANIHFLSQLKNFFGDKQCPERKIALLQLDTRWKNYQKLTKELEQALQDRQKAENSTAAAVAACQAQQQAYQEIEQSANAARKAFQEIQQALQQQFGKDDVGQKMHALQTQAESIKNEAKQLEQQLSQAQRKAAAADTLSNTLAAQKTAMAAECLQKQNSFEFALQAQGFANANALQAAYKPAEVIETMRQELQQSEMTLSAAQLQFHRTQQEWLEAREKKISTETVNILLEKVDFNKKKKEDADRQTGTLYEQLRQDDQEREKKARWDAERNIAQIDFSLYSELNALAGLQDGSRLRNFVQRWTFRLLLKEANFYLQRMRSRYTLIAYGSQGLDCAVEDADMAGITRTAANLSGGETFLVSLALALALSRISSRGLRMETLFLDEGFGTLDPATLEKALTALENLQADSNKLIGLISHVEEVADRIDTHIEVLPRGSTGLSTLRGPGVTAAI